MKTKLFLSAICAIMLHLTCLAQVNLSDLSTSKDPISNNTANTLLSKVYLHNPLMLNDAIVTISLGQHVVSWKTMSNHECHYSKISVFICSVKTENLPTEYYAVSIIDNKVIDGTFLGHNGDSKVLTLIFPRGEMRYEPNPTLNFDFKGDTIKVLRTYDFFTTALGGKWFHKNGTICNPFVVSVVSSSGTIKQLTPIATAIREDGDANYLSEDHKQPTRSKTEGEYFPLGMKVLTCAQTPASCQLDADELNKTAVVMMNIINKYGEEAPETPETLSVMEFAKYSFNLGMRHSNEFLTWIANNPKTEQFTYFIQAVASENENNELEWLKDNIKNLKDKKVRKWWQKWMKENKL